MPSPCCSPLLAPSQGRCSAASPRPLGILAGRSHQQLSLGLKVGAGAFNSCRCLWVRPPPPHALPCPLPPTSLVLGNRPLGLAAGGLCRWVLEGLRTGKDSGPHLFDWASRVSWGQKWGRAAEPPTLRLGQLSLLTACPHPPAVSFTPRHAGGTGLNTATDGLKSRMLRTSASFPGGLLASFLLFFMEPLSLP